jgi:hypothetical protein
VLLFVSQYGVGGEQSLVSSQPALQVFALVSHHCPVGQSAAARQITHAPVDVSHTGPPGSFAQSVLL